MSPLSVSDTLPLDESYFDVVIFDEASQITLEEGLPPVYRAKQTIVVGDEMQMPPSNFLAVIQQILMIYGKKKKWMKRLKPFHWMLIVSSPKEQENSQVLCWDGITAVNMKHWLDFLMHRFIIMSCLPFPTSISIKTPLKKLL